MRLLWKTITSLPSNVLNQEAEEVVIKYEEPSHKKEKRKAHKKKGKKPYLDKIEEQWLPDTGQGQLVVDIYEDEDKNVLVVKSTIAGVKTEEIDITVEPDLIVIRGKREKDKDKESCHYYYQECFWGNFSRTLVLPTRILPDKVKASLKNGILTVILPKSEEDQGGESIEVEE